MADDGPQIVRPIPRRPFNLNFTSSSTLDNDDDGQDSPPGQRDMASPRFLNPSYTPTDDASTISRPASFLNLTSSTLMGIYSQAKSNSRDPAFMDRDEPDTPWGTGAQTPIKRPSIDDATYELMRDRSHLPRRRLSYRPGGELGRPPDWAAGTALSLTLRAGLLFLLGVGYGLLVTHLHDEQDYLADLAEGIIKPGANWAYLAFWGVSGVVLGSLLPWFDKVWERSFGSELEDDAVAGSDGEGVGEKQAGPGTDWALVMRAIGAFVGIIFAIRKLAWASTLQVSVTLALVNPLLWWLIDRSKPGFLLSAGVGLTGSMLLLSVNPEMMPAPSRLGPYAGTTEPHNASATAGAAPAAAVLGGLASQETVETGVWMLSVLFCSCVCFGNIGRRLAWGRSAVGRGRWGGVR